MKMPLLFTLLVLIPFVGAIAVTPPSIDLGTITGNASAYIKIYNEGESVVTYFISTGSQSIISPSEIKLAPNIWKEVPLGISPLSSGRAEDKVFISEQIGSFQNSIAVAIRYNAVNITTNKDSLSQHMQTNYESQTDDNAQITDKQQPTNRYIGEKMTFFSLAALAACLLLIKRKGKEKIKEKEK